MILLILLCGAYGTRTRDPMRDRHVVTGSSPVRTAKENE